MKIAIGSDHAGYPLKEELKRTLPALGHTFVDLGTDSLVSVDYPDFAQKVCVEVLQGGCERGIIVCGTGIGVCITANKIHGIRAAACYEAFSAKMSREHNDCNVLTLGARMTGIGLAEEIVAAFLGTEFSRDRHVRRVNKIMAIEQQNEPGNP